jgi:hypothetical protein
MENPGLPELPPEPLPVSEHTNGNTPPAPAVDFAQEMRKAQSSGDFDFVMSTAKQSQKMLVDFKEAIESASFDGRSSAAIAMGLNFLVNMIAQATQQVKLLKQTAQATREAIKAAEKQVPPESYGGQ